MSKGGSNSDSSQETHQTTKNYSLGDADDAAVLITEDGDVEVNITDGGAFDVMATTAEEASRIAALSLANQTDVMKTVLAGVYDFSEAQYTQSAQNTALAYQASDVARKTQNEIIESISNNAVWVVGGVLVLIIFLKSNKK